MSSLRLINETEITSSVSSVDITDVFSADFDIYKIVTNNISTAGSSQVGLDLRFINSAGSVNNNSSYDYAYVNLKPSASFIETRSTNQNHMENFFGVASPSTSYTSSVGYVINPFSSSTYNFVLHEALNQESGTYRAQKYIGVLKTLDSHTGFRLFETQSRPFNSGVIRTYGLRV